MTITIPDLIENHAINSRVFSIGDFDFTKLWMNFSVRHAGGFVGKIDRKDKLSSGLYAIVPSLEPTADHRPSKDFLKKLRELETNNHTLFVATILNLTETITGDEQSPKLEASFQNENLFIDRVRGLFIAQSGSKAIREEVGTVTTFEPDIPTPYILAQPSDEITYHLKQDMVGMVVSHAESGDVIYVIPMQDIKPTAICLSIRTVIIYGLHGVPTMIATMPSKSALLQKLSKPKRTTILEIDRNYNCRATDLKITLGSSRVSSSSSEQRP